MSNNTFLSSFWEGFEIIKSHKTDSLITITLKPDSTAHCQCGRSSDSIHDYQWRVLKETMMFDIPVELLVQTRRINCPDCGVKTEAIPWVAPYARITNRLKGYIEKLLPLLPIKHISELTGVHWHTIKEIDKQRLKRVVPTVPWSDLRQLVMDEFAIFKGHRYATVIADAQTHQVLWIGIGRSRKDIRPFFEELGDNAVNIEVVAMDMNTAFDLEVQAHCPNARIVYDMFHVVAKFGREVMDRVRVDQANQLKTDKKARRWIKRSRWVLLKNRENLNVKQQSYLDEILSINRDLMITHLLGAQLKELWYCDSEEHAKGLWEVWWQQVNESGIQPLINFARKLKPYLHGIVASASYHLNTCTLEGINNKIKLIKRMGYGYRDTDYFFLKIKAAFPGKPR
ncbi:ISL3 family transposase [Vibrio sp. 10N]|uniref:ISL3 family transposase n=1 Tax=Vibrio sp. 10N TaxID=3058938 RepID=UPI0030C6BCA1